MRQLAELNYPAGVSLDQPAALGQALAAFLRGKQFSARAAVVGLPAKWTVATPKEVPAAADAPTRANILRLAAEAEFSTELKDLAFDYVTGDRPAGAEQSVLLMATQRRYVDAVALLLRAARLTAVAVMPTAVALGHATARTASAADALVLAFGSTGAELTAQQGGSPNAVRHLRSPASEGPFLGELRRAVSSLPPSRSRRELVLWNAAGLDTAALGTQLGLSVRRGDLPELGLDGSMPAKNGAAAASAPAIALALAGLQTEGPAIDFLHSRLAPPKARRIPRWAMLAAAAAVLLIGFGVYAYVRLQQDQADLSQLQARLDGMKSEISVAEAFVSRVSFAQGWHGGQPRYLACLRDLTAAIPDDGLTYATSLIVREPPRPTATGGTLAGAAKRVENRALAGQLYGKTSDQQHVQIVLDHLKANPAFAGVKLGGTQDAGRGREVSFSITFDYLPAKAAP